MPEGTRPPWLGKLAISFAIGVGAAVVAVGLARTDFIENIELVTYDWRMRLTARPSAPSDDIVLVSIDDDSVQRMASIAGRWPWPRMIHGYVLDYLSRAPAKVIVYDVLFTEPDVRSFNDGEQEWSGAQSDAALVTSIQNAGNVIAAADVAAERLVDQTRAIPLDPARPVTRYPGAESCLEQRDRLVPPILPLEKAARAIGHTLMLRDPDGPLRHHWPFVRVGDEIVPSLGMAAALHARGDAASIPSFSTCPPLIAYRGPTVGAGGEVAFNDYSFYSLFVAEQQLLAGERPEVDPATFKDKIVVVSATASGTYEVQATPFAQGIAGGEIHANIIDALLRDRRIERASAATAIATTVGVAVAIGALGAAAGAWTLALIAALVAFGLTYAAVRVFAAGTWLPLTMPMLGIGLAFVGQLAWQYFVEGREKRQVKKVFSRYVPKDVYNQLLADPDAVALGGKRRTMTVLFSDVRGFTAMSEKATPEEVVTQLNEYFTRMVDVLFAHRGTLDKFVGDMVMGLFGAPLDDPDHADHAVQTALAMTRALDELNDGWAAAGRPVLDIGIGISTGDMVAGNIGSSAIMSYTVIGDTVNLGARLESLNKDYGTRVIISEATRASLKGQYDIRPLGEVTVKGKSRPVAIYEVRAT
jgi:adenylate cyclase